MGDGRDLRQRVVRRVVVHVRIVARPRTVRSSSRPLAAEINHHSGCETPSVNPRVPAHVLTDRLRIRCVVVLAGLLAERVAARVSSESEASRKQRRHVLAAVEPPIRATVEPLHLLSASGLACQ